MNGVKQHIATIDVMNVLACIAVIVLHVNGAIWAFSYDGYWASCLVTECLFYWAVPVFFMITGATLMDYRERYTTEEFFKKRIKKVVIPFLFWSIVSIYWAIHVSHYLDPASVQDWRGFWNAIINTQGMSIYWFFVPQFCLYLCIPFLSYLTGDARKYAFRYGIVISFLITCCLPQIAGWLGISLGPLQYPLNGGGYVLYLLVGYYVTHYTLPPKFVTHTVYPMGAFALILRYVGTLVRSNRAGSVDMFYSGYSSFTGVLFSVAVFIWLWNRDWSFFKSERAGKVLRTLSGASFGIYLVHFYILRFFVDTFNIYMAGWKWRLLGIPMVYLSALAVTLLLKKIPIVKNLVP